jgi:hypothetical protein
MGTGQPLKGLVLQAVYSRPFALKPGGPRPPAPDRADLLSHVLAVRGQPVREGDRFRLICGFFSCHPGRSEAESRDLPPR